MSQNLGQVKKSCDLCRYFTNHLLKSIPIWKMGTFSHHGWLAFTQRLKTLSSVLKVVARGQNQGNLIFFLDFLLNHLFSKMQEL